MPIGRPYSLATNVATKVVTKTATAGQTSFTVDGGYRIGEIEVYRNGVRLVNAKDYTATNASTVILVDGATVGDSVSFHVFDSFNVANTIKPNESEQTINGNLTITGNLVSSGGINTSSNIGFGTTRPDSIARVNNTTILNAGIITAYQFYGDLAGDVTSSGAITISDTTASTSTSTGALIVSGGVGIGKSLLIGEGVSVAGTITYNDVTNVDSVGIVTAGKGLRATTGGLVVTAGVSTFSDSIGVAVDKFINLKNSSDATKFSIRHQNSGETTFNNTQSGANVQFLNSTNSSAAFEFRVKYGFGAASGFDLNGNGHLVPAADSASDLGLTGTRWRNLYADTLYGDGSTLTGVASTTILEDAGINTAGTSTFTNILATGIATAANFDSTSDIRLKTNIEVIQDPLAKVIQIEGVSFNWKQDNRPALGVIADQVQQILPQLVHGDDPKTVNYNGLIGLLIEAVKEQQTQIDELKSKLS